MWRYKIPSDQNSCVQNDTILDYLEVDMEVATVETEKTAGIKSAIVRLLCEYSFSNTAQAMAS